MSTSSIHLKTINGPARLRLLDHKMNPVITGYGELEKAELDAGLYMLEIDAGSHHEERIIALKPGEPFRDLKMEVQFPSAVPMGGTSTSRESHAYPAATLSQNPNLNRGHGGRLMLFLRYVPKEGDGDDTSAPPSNGQGIDLGVLRLLDRNLEPVVAEGLAVHDAGNAADGWAGICVDLDPGGYALEFPRPQQAATRSPVRERAQQSLWVAEGWTTLVFLPCLPGQSLPSFDLASIHMTSLHEGFQPYEDEAMEVNQAAEMATHGFRTGERMLPADLLNLLLGTKFQNPMLGILGAHVLLQSRQPKWQLFDTVVKNLKKMLGQAPDCIALEILGRERRNQDGAGFLAISWPPMLAAGYRGLISWDAEHPGLVAPDSVADHAAAVLHTSWPWARWNRLAPSRLGQAFFTPAAEATSRGATKRGLDVSDRSVDDVEVLFASLGAKLSFSVDSRSSKDIEIATDRAETTSFSSPLQKAQELVYEWLKTSGVESKPVTRGFTESPEVTQVAEYLQRMAEQTAQGRADLSKMGLGQLSRRVGLPVSAVRRAISLLKD